MCRVSSSAVYSCLGEGRSGLWYSVVLSFVYSSFTLGSVSAFLAASHARGARYIRYDKERGGLCPHKSRRSWESGWLGARPLSAQDRSKHVRQVERGCRSRW